MKRHRSSLSVLVLMLLSCGVALAEDRRTIGNLSFDLPAGWTLQTLDAKDHVYLQKIAGGRYCQVTIFESRPASADLDAEFATEWAQTAGPVKDTVPPTTRRNVGGRTIVEGRARSTAIDGAKVEQRLILLDGGGQVTSFTVRTHDRKSLEPFQAEVDALLASVKFPPSTSTSVVSATGNTSQTRPASNVVVATSVTVADLAGQWDHSEAGSTGYVDYYTGTYAGSSTVFYGEMMKVRKDGTFDYKFVGRSSSRNNPGVTVREEDRGRITLSGTLVTIDFETRGDRQFTLMGFVTIDGATTMTFAETDMKMTPENLELQCSFVNGGIVSCAGAKSWVREKK